MRRSEFITVNLSREERARVVAQAAKERRSLSAFARLLLLDASPKLEKSSEG